MNKERAKSIAITTGKVLGVVGTSALIVEGLTACQGETVNNYISLPTPEAKPPMTTSTETVPGGTSKDAFDNKVKLDEAYYRGRFDGQRDQAIIDAPLINKPAVVITVTPDKKSGNGNGDGDGKKDKKIHADNEQEIGTPISFNKNEEKTVHAGTVLSGDVKVEGWDYCNYWWGGYYHTEKRLFDNTQRTGTITIALDDERIEAPYGASGITGLTTESDIDDVMRSQAKGTFDAWPEMKTITVFRIKDGKVVSTIELTRKDVCK
jgi:hypothetical protein